MKQERKLKISALIDQIYQNARDMGIAETHAGKHPDIWYKNGAEAGRKYYRDNMEEAIQDLCNLLGMKECGPKADE